MKTQKSTLRSILLALASFGTVHLASFANAQIPAGDLTVTVQELEGDEVRFTVAGSAPLKAVGGFSSTAYDPTANTPPHNLTEWTNLELPVGLMLSAGGSDYPLNYAYFSNTGYWFLGTFSSASFPEGTSVVGSGTGTSSMVPFSHFVPGTYVVSGDRFDVTYRVLPIPTPPRLSVRKPLFFSPTKVGRSSKAKSIRITNIGGTAATGVSVRKSGKASGDFLLTRPRGTLAPGASTTFKATFRPRSKGARSATVTVRAANAASRSFTLRGTGTLRSSGPRKWGPRPGSRPSRHHSVLLFRRDK